MTDDIYYGTKSADAINTGDLQERFPVNTIGFDVNGLDGDDILTSSFIGRGGSDRIDGGKGNDSLSVWASFFSPPTREKIATLFGGSGTDLLFINDMSEYYDYYSIGSFSIVNGFIEFTIIGDGQHTKVKAFPDIEAIFIHDKWYLTEDIWNGRIRAVGDHELNARAYGEKADWWLNDLETYSQYNSAISNPAKSTQDIDGDSASNRPEIGRLYTAAFGRIPDQSGISYWSELIDDGITNYKGVANEFVNSGEFNSRFGENISNDQFISNLYQNILGRSPELAGWNFWVDQMSNGLPKNEVLIEFANSAENIALYESLT